MLSLLPIVESVLIESSPAHVWEILVRPDRYREWNEFLVDAQGQFSPGGSIRVTVRPPGGRPHRFRFHVERLVPREDIRLSYIPYVSGLLDRDWDLHLEALGANRTRFTQHLLFRGRLVPLYGARLERASRAGLRAMNAALKARAEARPKKSPGGVCFTAGNGGGN